jgi:hypothetical protein
MKKIKYLVLKNELKTLAKEIRYWKSKRKFKNRGDFPLWDIENRVRTRKYEFRHRHIAYCQLRGRLREQIERPAPDNLPNERYIERIVEKHGEVIRASAQGSV